MLLTDRDEMFNEFAASYSEETHTVSLLTGLRNLVLNEATAVARPAECQFMIDYVKHALEKPNPSQVELHAAVSSAMCVLQSIFCALLDSWSQVESIDSSLDEVRNLQESLDGEVRRYRQRVGGDKSGRSRRMQRERDLNAAALAWNRLNSYSNHLSPTLDDLAAQLNRDREKMAYPAKGGWERRVRHLGKKAIKIRADKLRN